MPGFDRTGPTGRGPRTGRGMGLCGGFFGRGFGMGGGFGFRRRCWAPWNYAEYPAVDERRFLEEELAAMKSQTEALEKRLRELETQGN